MPSEFYAKNLANGQLPDSLATFYTVPGSRVAIIRSLMLVNNSASAITVHLFINFGAGSRRIIPVLLLGGETKYEDDSSITLEAGDYVCGYASVAAQIDYIISGVEQV